MLLLMLALDVYLGYMHQNTEVSVDGYHVIHFIVLYYIGCYLSEKPIKAFARMGGVNWLMICIACVLMHAVKVRFAPMAILFTFRYNALMVMLATLALFHWVMKWKLQKNWVNWISASVLSVYLIQSQAIGGKLLFGTCDNIHNTFSTIPAAILMVVVVVGFYACCILVDKVRIKICNPINECVAKQLIKIKI